jgi:hypothetical protein
MNMMVIRTRSERRHLRTSDDVTAKEVLAWLGREEGGSISRDNLMIATLLIKHAIKEIVLKGG